MRNAPKASLDTCAGGPLLHTWRAQTFELYVRIYIYISCIFDGLEPHLLTSLQNHGPSKYLENWTTIGHPRQLQLTKVRPWAAWAVGNGHGTLWDKLKTSSWWGFAQKRGWRSVIFDDFMCQLCHFYICYPPKSSYGLRCLSHIQIIIVKANTSTFRSIHLLCKMDIPIPSSSTHLSNRGLSNLSQFGRKGSWSGKVGEGTSREGRWTEWCEARELHELFMKTCYAGKRMP